MKSDSENMDKVFILDDKENDFAHDKNMDYKLSMLKSSEFKPSNILKESPGPIRFKSNDNTPETKNANDYQFTCDVMKDHYKNSQNIDNRLDE